jgi:hypothetical protein
MTRPGGRDGKWHSVCIEGDLFVRRRLISRRDDESNMRYRHLWQTWASFLHLSRKFQLSSSSRLLLHDADASISLIHVCICLAIFITLLSLDSLLNVCDCANILFLLFFLVHMCCSNPNLVCVPQMNGNRGCADLAIPAGPLHDIIININLDFEVCTKPEIPIQLKQSLFKSFIVLGYDPRTCPTVI